MPEVLASQTIEIHKLKPLALKKKEREQNNIAGYRNFIGQSVKASCFFAKDTLWPLSFLQKR